MKFFTLPNGRQMPMVGFGTYQGSGDEIQQAVEWAIDAGYRLIDTAFVYQNEDAVGAAVQKKIKEGVVKREDLFIVTKLHGQYVQTPELSRHCMMESLKNLQMDYVDLWLIHTPFGIKRTSDPKDVWPINKELGHIDWDYSTNVVETWKGIECLVKEGLTRALGVSNFSIKQMERIQAVATVPISAQQIECHGYHLQEQQYEFCKKHNIAFMAYGPIGAAYLARQLNLPVLLENEVVNKLATKYKKSPAQICLRFLVDMGRIVIPKSTNQKRIKENFELFDFNFEEADLKMLVGINRNESIFLKFDTMLKGADKHPEFKLD